MSTSSITTNNNKKNSNNDNEIQLINLERTEEDFNNLFNQLERAQQGSTTSSNKDLRRIIRQTFDAMRDTTLQWLDSSEFNSGDGASTGDGAADTQPLPAKSNNADTIPTPPANEDDLFGRLSAYSRSRRREHDSDVPSGSVSSLRTVTFDDEEDQIPEVAEPAVASAGYNPRNHNERILAMLRRMAQRLLGFFQRTLQMIKEAACKVWNGVCEAFAGIFSFFQNLWHWVSGQGNNVQESDQASLTGSTESLLGRHMQHSRQAFKYHAA